MCIYIIYECIFHNTYIYIYIIINQIYIKYTLYIYISTWYPRFGWLSQMWNLQNWKHIKYQYETKQIHSDKHRYCKKKKTGWKIFFPQPEMGEVVKPPINHSINYQSTVLEIIIWININQPEMFEKRHINPLINSTNQSGLSNLFSSRNTGKWGSKSQKKIGHLHIY